MLTIAVYDLFNLKVLSFEVRPILCDESIFHWGPLTENVRQQFRWLMNRSDVFFVTLVCYVGELFITYVLRLLLLNVGFC